MNEPNKYQFTVKWTQNYSSNHLQAHDVDLQAALDRSIETQLERDVWPEARQEIERIKNASKSN